MFSVAGLAKLYGLLETKKTQKMSFWMNKSEMVTKSQSAKESQ